MKNIFKSKRNKKLEADVERLMAIVHDDDNLRHRIGSKIWELEAKIRSIEEEKHLYKHWKKTAEWVGCITKIKDLEADIVLLKSVL